MPAGRKVGQLSNPRDERGWMIPRPGTIRRQVYEMSIAGMTNPEISQALKISKQCVVVHQHYFRHADQVNARELRNRRRWGT